MVQLLHLYEVCFTLFYTNTLPAVASVGSVNNFRIVSITGQNVSFSWEVDNVPIGNISYFEIWHHTKVPEISNGRGGIHIWVDKTANSTNGQNLTFAHIVDVGTFGYLLQKIMYLRVILTNYDVLESEQIYADTRELCPCFVCHQPEF